MRFHLESTSKKKSIARAIKPILETLESRQMLTIVEGEQLGFYQNGNDEYVRISVRGGGALAFVGSSIGADGRAQLNDIPMTILDPNTGALIRENLGGVGGRDGIAPISEVTTAPPGFPVDSFMRSTGGGGVNGFYNFFGPTEIISYEALASNTAGRTYALHRRIEGFGASEENPGYDVLGVNNQNGRVEVLDSIEAKILAALQADNPEFKSADLGELFGADFDPSNPDMLYIGMIAQYPFVTGTSFNRKEVPILLTYDIRAETVSFVNRFGANSSTDTFEVADFTFLNNNEIAFFGSVQRQNQATREGLFITDKTRPGPDNFQQIVLGTGDDAEPVTEIAAMESLDGSYILVVDGNQQMLRVDLDADGDVIGTIVQGGTIDPDVPEDADPKRGADISDLAFNPRLIDSNGFQFDKRGVLLGTDRGTDELIALDIRQRFPSSDVYAIFDAEATTDTSLAMSIVTLHPNQDLSFEQRLFQGTVNPFGGTAGSIFTGFNDAGEPVITPLNNGGVFIGGRSLDEDDNPTNPVLSLTSDRDPLTGDYVGTLPGVRLPTIVNPGIYISGAIRDIFIGGTIMGRVSIAYSVDQFYAGNIITGDQFRPASASTDNFFVGADLRNLMVRGTIGWLDGADNDFQPDTDFAIGGRVQSIKSGGEIRAAFDVAGKVNSLSNRTAVKETEIVVRASGNNVGNAFHLYDDETGSFLGIANQGFNRNDSVDNPQILGAIADRKGRNDKVTVLGTINNGPNFGDATDVYGIPVLAGEGAVVQLVSNEISPGVSNQNDVQLEIQDPSGRIYYTDQSNQNFTREDREFLDDVASFGQPISFTADKPGIWRVIVRATGVILSDRLRPYTLNISQIGSISLGGLHSNASIFLNNPTLGVRVRSGDLGAIMTGQGTSELYGASLGTRGSTSGGRESTFDNPIIAQRGNIRAIEAANLSHLENGVLSGYPIIVASGKLGQVHADDRLYMNNTLLTLNSITNGQPSKNIVNGGDIQVIEAGGNFQGVLATKGSIGVIRAGTIDNNVLFPASYFQINADGKGNDELGLIDSVGSIGNFAYGGPALSAGNGANIKYIRAGGSIYRDRFFGFGSVIVQTATNRSITVTDDTGAEVSVKPITGTFTTSVNPDTTTGGGGTDTTNGGTGTDTTPFSLPDPFGGNGGTNNGTIDYPDPFDDGGTGGLGGVPDPFGGDIPVITDPTDPDAGVPDDAEVIGALQLETYPVRSGGFVITSVESTTGISIATNREGGGGVADISTIITGNRGTALTVDEDGNLLAEPTFIDPDLTGAELQQALEDANRFLDVILVGNSRINVFQMSGSATGVDGANYTRVDNFTDGEIVNINADSAAVITGEWLGVARKVSGVAPEGVTNVADTRFTGVATLYPYNNAKNMIFVTNASTIGARGPMGNITIKERVQNLVANADNRNVKGVLEGIVAPIMVYTGDEATVGNIDRIDIGEGLAYSGSGEIALSGIYSTDTLGTITNINGGGDLRGDVVVRNYLERITLTGGGSIIDADIYALEVGADARELIDGPTPANGFEVALERINIIPTISVINDSPENPYGIGKISISGAGGMMNTRVVSYNIGKLTLNKGSFGVLTSDFLSETGGTMGGISADGLGIRYVSYRGGSYIGDIIATGTGKLRSTSEFSRSVRGSETSAFDVSTGNSLSAANDLHRFLGTTKGKPAVANVTNDGMIEDSLIEANRNIRLVKGFAIRVVRNPLEARPRDETYPMQINTGGELKQVSTARNIEGLRVVSGTTGNIDSGNDIKNFQLQTTGFVNRVSAKRNFLGSSNLNLVGSASINQINIGGNMTGTAYVAKGIRSLVVGGNFGAARTQGGVYTPQSINQVLISGDVTSGSLLQAKNIIKQLVIGGDVQSGAQVVAKSITSKRIKGDVDGIVT
jgi:hypothetical protein